MNQWYYARGGQQQGPVGIEELRALIRNGVLHPGNDLVWNASMPDWLPTAQVPELMAALQEVPAHEQALDQPFAYQLTTGPMAEIVPGSEPLIPTACVKRAFDLTVRNLGPLIIILVCFVAVSWGADYVFQQIDKAMGWGSGGETTEPADGTDPWQAFQIAYSQGNLSVGMSIISQILSVFLWLGATKVGLNVVSGKPFSVGMLFSGGKWLVRGFIAHVLYILMVVLGLILLVFPGIYLGLRFGMYQNAIVDRNLGVMDAFAYSSSVTQNNLLNLFVIGLFSFLIMLAGCLALGVGLIFAYPMMWLLWIVAYRWLQYGGRAIMDDPVTGLPLLAAVEEAVPVSKPVI